MLISESQVAELVGCDRRTVAKRINELLIETQPGPKNANLLDSRKILLMREADPDQGSLEEARIADTWESAKLKKIQREKLEGNLCDIDYVLGIINTFHDFLIAGIKQSNIPDEEKEDLLGSIVDFARKLGDEGLIE